MLEQVLETIRKFRMISPGQRVAVACSGGPDSTSLALILRELSGRLGCTLSLCHFHHGLRAEQSDRDEQFVRQLAARLQLPLHRKRADVRRSAREARMNLERKARELRYGFFLGLVESGEADRVAVGHTADDQAETVIHRLLRGAGTKGLAGIYPVVDGKIIRPLLAVRHNAILDWLRVRQEPWREDSSNSDFRYTRNRIRHQLLPRLAEFNPRIVETLADTAEIARDEEDFWQEYLQPILSQSIRCDQEKTLVAIDRLRRAPAAVARRVLRRAIGNAAQLSRGGLGNGFREIFSGTRGLANSADFGQIQRLLRLALDGQSGSEMPLSGNVTARKEFSHLVLEKGGKALKRRPAFCHPVRVPGKVEVPEIGSSFAFELIPLARGQARYNNPGGLLLDARFAAFPLTLRNWQPGDGYRPRGHRRLRKLKELFQRSRIPIRERRQWPVILSGKRIVWARGWEVAEGFSPRPRSRQAVRIQESRL